jgi:hypothetical protein
MNKKLKTEGYIDDAISLGCSSDFPFPPWVSLCWNGFFSFSSAFIVTNALGLLLSHS